MFHTLLTIIFEQIFWLLETINITIRGRRLRRSYLASNWCTGTSWNTCTNKESDNSSNSKPKQSNQRTYRDDHKCPEYNPH